MTAAEPTPVLVGREADLAVLDQFARSVPIEGGALVVHGEPGVGKSALLDAASEHATGVGLRVLRAAGVQSELDLSLAGLGQLLLPVTAEVDRLPHADRDLLRAVLGQQDGPAVGAPALSAAISALLRQVSGMAPVLLVVDDVHWLDRASADVLGAVARAKGLPGVGVLVAQRTGARAFFDGSGLTGHEVHPLPAALAAALVRSRFPHLADSVTARVLALANGNPLGLLELPAALDEAQQTAADELPEALPLSRRIQSLYSSRLLALPEPTRQALLVAALHDSQEPLLEPATAQDALVFRPAEQAGLVAVDRHSGHVRFRHPLVRSTVVELCPSNLRRLAHRELASRYPPEDERAAWHAAAGSIGPDEEVAARIERVAEQIRRRGDAVGAVRALIHAADLSADSRGRARRLADAAYVGADVSGDLRRASQLLREARQTDPDSTTCLHAATASSYLLLNGTGDIDTAHRLLTAALDEAAERPETDITVVAEAVHNLLEVCLYGARSELWPAFEEAVRRLPLERFDVLRLWTHLLVDPVRTAVPAIGELDAAIAGLTAETDPARVERIATAAIYVDRVEDARFPLLQLLADARCGRAITPGIMAAMLLALEAFQTGHWSEARRLVAEGLELCESHGYGLLRWPLLLTEALLAAGRGDDSKTAALCDEMAGWGRPRNVGSVQLYAWHAQALGALGRGDFERAYLAASAISAPGVLAAYVGHAVWVVMDLVEAAVNAGHAEAAAAHVAALDAAGISALSSRTAFLVAGARAMAAPGFDRQLFDRALSMPGAERWPFELARIRLFYGQRLRRTRSVVEARTHLIAALSTFEQLGATAWCTRTSAELLATQPVKGAAAGARLTPQERSVAVFAAAGMTNKQIAEHMLISPRTVGAHLHHIFPKLGVSTRAALADALAAYPDDSD